MKSPFLFKSKQTLVKLAATAACITGLFTSTSVFATTPPAQLKTQVPGYFRMPLGDFEITALYDGYIKLDHNQLLKNVTAPNLKKLLGKMFISNPDVQTSISAYLINTGTNLICQLRVENVFLEKEYVLKKACRKSSENMDKQALC
jgi:hypothetical protein